MTNLTFVTATMYSNKSSEITAKYQTLSTIQHKEILVFTTEEDFRAKNLCPTEIKSKITTRHNQQPGSIFSIEAYIIERVNLFDMAKEKKPFIILCDEVQFIKKFKVLDELARIVDELDIPVFCYGLKQDSDRRFFPASEYLLKIADDIEIIENWCCFCSRTATDNLRTTTNNIDIPEEERIYIPVFNAEQKQLEIGNTRYFQTCRKHYNEIEKMANNLFIKDCTIIYKNI